VFQTWWRKDQLLVSWLLSSLSEEVMPSVLGLTSASAIWAALAATFGRPSESRILQLQMQLHNTKQEPGEDVSKFLRRSKLIAEELAAAGAPVDSRVFNAAVFTNLQPNFSQAVMALVVRQAPVPLDELVEIMTSHELRLRLQQALVIGVHHTWTSPTFEDPAPTRNPARNQTSFDRTNKNWGGHAPAARGRGRLPQPR